MSASWWAAKLSQVAGAQRTLQAPQRYQPPGQPQYALKPEYVQQAQPQRLFQGPKPNWDQMHAAAVQNQATVADFINNYATEGNKVNGIAKVGAKALVDVDNGCPECGSGNYFSRHNVRYTSASGPTPVGMAPAPQCFDCGYSEKYPGQGQASTWVTT